MAEIKKKKVKSPSDAERRTKGERVPIQLLVDYRADGHYLFDFCRDIGSGGVFIDTTAPRPIGSKIELTFTIPDNKETLSARGEVIWVQDVVKGRPEVRPGMGIQFQEFTSEHKHLLEEFISRYSDKKTA
jgi:type IV pilus assembly protein PilZ